MKKEIPILFSTPMVQAILEGRKTMTRRIVKPQPEPPRAIYNQDEAIGIMGKKEETHDSTGLLRFNWRTERYFPKIFQDGGLYSHKCPYGKPGDILWVRESWWSGYTWNEANPEETKRQATLFRADTKDARPCDVSDEWCANEYGLDKRDWPHWKPSIHMPKAACRIWLQVESVKAERLHDITEDDAKAEGAEDGPWGHVDRFRHLWQSINGDQSWGSNPWVWVVSFKVLSPANDLNSTQHSKHFSHHKI